MTENGTACMIFADFNTESQIANSESGAADHGQGSTGRRQPPQSGRSTTKAQRSQRRSSIRPRSRFRLPCPCPPCLRSEHSCETKPIPAKRPAMQSNWAFPFFRLLSFLSAITSSVAAEGRARPPGSLWQGFVRNKANSARAKRETSPLWQRSYDEIASRPAPPNKANFLDRGPLPCQHGPGIADHAKQSQFPRHRRLPWRHVQG